MLSFNRTANTTLHSVVLYLKPLQMASLYSSCYSCSLAMAFDSVQALLVNPVYVRGRGLPDMNKIPLAVDNKILNGLFRRLRVKTCIYS